MTFKRRAEKKLPVEDLQREHLSGPAEMTANEASEALQEESVVAVTAMPKYETITFRNQRDPGIPLEFHYSSKQCPFKAYKLIDGHKYDLPREVIQNLEQCRENKYKYRKNADGNPEAYVSGYKSHFVCERT